MLTILIGLPCSGKSTYRNTIKTSHKYISRDYIIDMFAYEHNKTYDQIFSDKYLSKEIDKIVELAWKNSIKHNDDIIVDMTNLTKKRRHKWISEYRKHHKNEKIVGVLFEVPFQTLWERNKKRSFQTSKSIPLHVYESMQNIFQNPELSEGFDEINIIKEHA